MMEDDMKKSLKKWGYWKKLTKGKIICDECGETITEDNLTAIMPRDGEVVFYCSVICIPPT